MSRVTVDMRQYFTDDTGVEYPICTKSLDAFMCYAVGKTVRVLLRTVTMIPYIRISQLSTYTEAYWKIDLHNLLYFLHLRMGRGFG